MAEWVGLAAEWLQPIYKHIRQGVLGDGYVQVDESSGARKPKGGAFARRAAPEGAGKHRSPISVPAMGKPNKDTSGSALGPAARASITGRPAAPPRAWIRSCPSTAKACCKAMATPPTEPLPASAAQPSPSPDVGRTRGAASTKRSRAPRATRCSSCARSATSTPSSGGSARAASGRGCGHSRAKSKAGPSSNGSGKPCAAGKRGTATYRKAPWARPSTTHWASGPR